MTFPEYPTITEILLNLPGDAQKIIQERELSCTTPQITIKSSGNHVLLEFYVCTFEEATPSIMVSTYIDPDEHLPTQLHKFFTRVRQEILAIPTEKERKFAALVNKLEEARELGEDIDLGPLFAERITESIKRLSSNALTYTPGEDEVAMVDEDQS